MVAPVLTVSLVASRTDHRSFCEFPYQLYRTDHHWVPPLRHAERRRWAAAHNASLERRWVGRFIARRHGRVVGRIAAIVDPEFNARWDETAGFFGFFECVPDGEVAAILLRQAEEALRDRGVKTVLGPINLTTHDEVGLLIEGFDLRPMVLSPYNPPYYNSLITDFGYQKRMDYYSYRWDAGRAASTAIERLLRMAARGASDADAVCVRSSDPERWDEDGRTFLELYNVSFADLWGFVPLTRAEYEQRAREFRPFYHPGLAIFAEVASRPVGFGLALPDINEILGAARGRLVPFGWLRLARGIRRISTARFLLIGVRPEYAGRGVGVLIAHEMVRAGIRLGIRHGELSLVQASNIGVRHVIDAFGGRRIKTYRLFRKSLKSR